MVDMVVHRRDLRDTLINLLRLLRDKRPPAAVLPLPQTGTRGKPGQGNTGRATDIAVPRA